MSFSAAAAHRFTNTCTAHAKFPFSRFIDVEIFSAKRMPPLAMFLRSFLSCCRLNHCGCIPLQQVPRFKNSYFFRDATMYSFNDHILTNSSGPRPVSGDHPNAHEIDPYIVMPIFMLICPWNPMAILRSVVSIIVSAIERVPRRTWPNVIAKVPETSATLFVRQPSFTNLYAATAVSIKMWISGSITAFEHVLIKLVKLPVERSLT